MDNMTFVYGRSVDGDNFTDREYETQRLKTNFEAGLNTILISPRRIGKTSLVKKVESEINAPNLKVVYMDIYDCRSEYDFYNKFASTIIKATSSKTSQILDNIKKFLSRLTPKISFSPGVDSDISVSLGLAPNNYEPEYILNLPEIIAKEHGYHLVVCIDEFQQIGEFSESINIQKKLRTIWQHQRNTSYCLFGSKKHMMSEFFISPRMPFYQFGEIMMLGNIPTNKWIPFLQSRFREAGKEISIGLAQEICEVVDNYSSYVQQLAWNVVTVSHNEVTCDDIKVGIKLLMEQCSALFVQQSQSLTTYQINFLRALASGISTGFGESRVQENFPMGSKSNIDRIQKSLIQKELIELTPCGYIFTDPVFRQWFLTQFPL